MRVALHPCHILHIKSYRETSLLLEIFSQQYGRFGMLAKGAKRKKHGLAHILQIYQHLLLSWVGKGELMVLTDAELQSQRYFTETTQMMAGFYMNELLMRLLHRYQAHANLYTAYETTLDKIATSEHIQPALRIFEKQLLQTLGYGLIFDHDVQTGAPIAVDKTYYYQFDRGPQLAPPVTEQAMQVSGALLQAMQTEVLDDPLIMRAAKQLMRHALARLLGDKPLASRALYKSFIENSRQR